MDDADFDTQRYRHRASFTTSKQSIFRDGRGNSAYVGFTAGTGGATAVQQIAPGPIRAASRPPSTIPPAFPRRRARPARRDCNRQHAATERQRRRRSQCGVERRAGQRSEFSTILRSSRPRPPAMASPRDPERRRKRSRHTGGGLGYHGIGSSVAVKFDLYNNAGEGSDSTVLCRWCVPMTPAWI